MFSSGLRYCFAFAEYDRMYHSVFPVCLPSSVFYVTVLLNHQSNKYTAELNPSFLSVRGNQTWLRTVVSDTHCPLDFISLLSVFIVLAVLKLTVLASNSQIHCWVKGVLLYPLPGYALPTDLKLTILLAKASWMLGIEMCHQTQFVISLKDTGFCHVKEKSSMWASF